MGGGAAMRAAAKVAGVTVGAGGLRGLSAEHFPAVRKASASRPAASAIATTAAEDMRLVASQGDMQRPSWELDEWEFAGGEEEMELMPRIVFGGAPTLEEAKEATSELSVALDKAYLSSPDSVGYGSSILASEVETKACISTENTVDHPVPTHAIQAFRFLNESPVAQAVVASIACDPNVWNAVLQNPELQEFLQAQKTCASFSDTDLMMKKSASNADLFDVSSPTSNSDTDLMMMKSASNADLFSASCPGSTTCSCKPAESESGFLDVLQQIKIAVVDMMSSLSSYFANIFGGQDNKMSAKDDGTARLTSTETIFERSFIALAVMAIVVIVLKRQ